MIALVEIWWTSLNLAVVAHDGVKKCGWVSAYVFFMPCPRVILSNTSPLLLSLTIVKRSDWLSFCLFISHNCTCEILSTTFRTAVCFSFMNASLFYSSKLYGENYGKDLGKRLRLFNPLLVPVQSARTMSFMNNIWNTRGLSPDILLSCLHVLVFPVSVFLEDLET